MSATEGEPTPPPEEASTASPPPDEGTDAGELAQKGGIVLALIVMAVAVFVAFQAVTDAISTWLEPRWVPIWRALFAVAVAVVAIYVVRQLTRVTWSS